MENVCKLHGIGEGYPEASVGPVLFGWHCETLGGKQKKYRLRVWDADGREFWNTNWVASDQSAQIPYRGKPLLEDHDYYVQADVETADGSIVQGRPEAFSRGIESNAWKAAWLRRSTTDNAAPLFSKKIFCAGEIRRARFYLCGLGYHEAYVNGTRAGKDFLAPAWTDYQKRVSYVSYDIAELLHPGWNGVGVQLGNGWYGPMHIQDNGILQFTAQISIEYQNGEKEWFYTQPGDGWYVHSNGPLKRDSIYHGTVYDARDEIAHWCDAEATYRKEDGWRKALLAEPPKGSIVPQNVEPIGCIDRLAPITITEPEKGVYVADFGQNLAGIVEIELEEPLGTQVEIRFAELIDQKGMLNTANLRAAQAKDVYIAKGSKQTYRPSFTYHGFRYAEITGITKPLQHQQLCALVLRSEVSPAGSFECSNPLINRIQTMCRWTESNNLHSVPTDCPQRDERLGWLNDLTVRAEEAVYNFDMHRFYRKYLQDIRDEQGEKTGAIPDTAPYIAGNRPADPVCSSYLMMGWLLYQHYGDLDVLRQFYDGFAAWVGYLENTSEEDIIPYSYYGDWAAPISESVEGSIGSGAVSGITPGELVSTGFLYYDATLMEKIANALGKQEDAAKWSNLAQRTFAALNRQFYHAQTGGYATNSQAANGLMLWLGVSPDAEKTAQQIVSDIHRHQTHLTTGNICTRYVLEALTENGYVDLAYQLVTQTTYPSWGYMVEKGATTIWERWEYVDSGSLLGMASHDHPMYASVSVWFYKYLLGIEPLEPGYVKFRVRPYLPTELAWAKGSVETVRGRIEVGWQQDENRKCILTIKVPFHSQCSLELTDDWTFDQDTAVAAHNNAVVLEAGEHTVTVYRGHTSFE